MTIFFQNNEIVIHRRRRLVNTNRFIMTATFTAYSADIQPATKERVEMFEGRFGSVYTAFVDASIDIKEGDQVLTSAGHKYSVKGVQRWSGAGLLDHLELVLVSQDGGN